MARVTLRSLRKEYGDVVAVESANLEIEEGQLIIGPITIGKRCYVGTRAVLREGTVMDEMKNATDFSDLAWIEVDAYEPHEGENGSGRVTIRREGLGYELEADMQGEGWIVISETAWKGWRAYVDGKPVRTHIANHAFLGVHVKQGRHRVRLVYLPESFTRGRIVSLVALVVIVGYAVSRMRGFAVPRNRETAQPL